MQQQPFKEQEDHYEVTTNTNHQGFVLKSKVPVDEIKLPLLFLVTDVQKDIFAQYQGTIINTKEIKRNEFVLFTLHSVAAASPKFKWFTGVKLPPGSSVEVSTRDNYSVTTMTLGTFKEFSAEDMGQNEPVG